MKDSHGGSFGLSKLRELTEKLPPFPLQVKTKSMMDVRTSPWDEPEMGSNVYKEYKMEGGECFAWFIHRSANDIAVHRWFNSEGSIFPEHTHPEKEWIIVYRGKMELTKGGVTQLLEAGDYSYNEPLVSHKAYFPEDCRYITVTIPPAKEFPNVT
jgi:quercetin dioxygenase-like cupin family protein